MTRIQMVNYHQGRLITVIVLPQIITTTYDSPLETPLFQIILQMRYEHVLISCANGLKKLTAQKLTHTILNDFDIRFI